MSENVLNLFDARPIDLLRTRRSGSAKAMTGPGPTGTQLQDMLACASRIPDHGKLAPWRFIVFEDEGRRRFGEILARTLLESEPDATPERLEQERGRFLRAPVVVGVVSRARPGLKIPEWEQVLSAGAACQTLCLSAHAMGFVAGWITEWYAYDPRISRALGLEEHERMAGFIYIGKPALTLEDRPRPPVDSITTWFR